MIRKRYSNKL